MSLEATAQALLDLEPGTIPAPIVFSTTFDPPSAERRSLDPTLKGSFGEDPVRNYRPAGLESMRSRAIVGSVMDWQPSDVIALVALVVGPLSGFAVAWYTARRQDETAHRQDMKDRRAAVEEALAEVGRVESAGGAATGQALIRTEQPYWKRVKPIGGLVPLADVAVQKLTYARVRHPDQELRLALEELAGCMRRLSMFADFVAWAEEHKPDDPRLEDIDRNLDRHLGTTREAFQRAEQRLHAYHAEFAGH